MKKCLFVVALAAMTGCCSYSQLKKVSGGPKIDGETPIATYEVVNTTYRLLNLVPISCGITWKSGPYSEEYSAREFFGGRCDFEDNLASVRHACKTVGSDKIRNITAHVDDSSAWSFFIVKKRVFKTSCVIVK